MAGPDGPVFLDAECAWYGDPAFDLAFCLNHLLLKCLAVPAESAVFLVAFDELRDAYLSGVTWEARAALEARAASLLPAFFSPGWTASRRWNTSPATISATGSGASAVPLIERPPATLAAVRDAWGQEVGVG